MRDTYKDVNVGIGEVGDDHQQDSLEEEILLAIGQLYIIHPYVDVAGFDGR